MTRALGELPLATTRTGKTTWPPQRRREAQRVVPACPKSDLDADTRAFVQRTRACQSFPPCVTDEGVLMRVATIVGSVRKDTHGATAA
jgi:hypothetical protein